MSSEPKYIFQDQSERGLENYDEPIDTSEFGGFDLEDYDSYEDWAEENLYEYMKWKKQRDWDLYHKKKTNRK